MSLTASALTELDERYPDAWLSALVDDRCRTLLSELRSVDTPITLPELGRRVATCEPGRPPDDPSAERLREVHMTIHHNHLPRLIDVGLVDVDRTGETLESVTVRADVPLMEE